MPYQYIDTLKKEFAEFYELLGKKIIITNGNEMPIEVEPRDLKRRGYYLDAVRECMRTAKQCGRITTCIIQTMFKSLACAGDLQDAMKLVDYMFTFSLAKDKWVERLYFHRLRLILSLEGFEGHSIIDYLKEISGNGVEYALKEEDMDLPSRTGMYADTIEMLNKEPQLASLRDYIVSEFFP
ncbi:MAG: hypothetical protein Q4B32_08420 [Clostridia bacterium]|nr:hypothetical protein [Clostridia bacterium]